MTAATNTQNGAARDHTGDTHDRMDDPGRAPEQAFDWRGEAQRALNAASQETRRLGHYARVQAVDAAERQKDGLARAIAGIADNLRSASDGLSDQPNIVGLVDQAADRVRSVANIIERKPADELFNDVEAACRRHPVAVAAGAFVVGALVSRALKSSGGGSRI